MLRLLRIFGAHHGVMQSPSSGRWIGVGHRSGVIVVKKWVYKWIASLFRPVWKPRFHFFDWLANNKNLKASSQTYMLLFECNEMYGTDEYCCPSTPLQFHVRIDRTQQPSNGLIAGPPPEFPLSTHVNRWIENLLYSVPASSQLWFIEISFLILAISLKTQLCR